MEKLSEYEKASIAFLGVLNIARHIRNWRKGFINVIDTGAEAKYEYVYPYSEFTGPVDPSVDLIREQLADSASQI